MMKKKLLAAILVLALVVTMMSLTASAANITVDQVTTKLNKLIDEKYKPGTRYSGSGECLGFAVDVFNYVFGTSLSKSPYPNAQFSNTTGLKEVWHLDNGKYTSSILANHLKQAKRGDMFLLVDPGSSYGHAMIMWSVSSSGTPTVYDANASSENKTYNMSSNAISLHEYTLGTAMCHKGGATLYRYVDYVDSSSTTPVKTTITFSSLTVPGTLTEGTDAMLDGSFTATNSKICNVKAEICDASSGAVKLSAVSGGNFSVWTYGPLTNSKLNTDLDLGKLKAGTYYVRYTVTTQDGTTTSKSTANFTVTHTWGGWTTTKAASCGVAGQQQRKCAHCGQTETKAISALSHNYQKTASTSAYDLFTCSNCKDSYRVDKVTWVQNASGGSGARSVSIRNSGDTDLPCCCLVARYQGGRLVSLTQETLNIPAGASENVSTGIPLDTGDETWKVFVLDDQSCAPVLPSLEY